MKAFWTALKVFFAELAVFFKEVGTPEFWPEIEAETGEITGVYAY